MPPPTLPTPPHPQHRLITPEPLTPSSFSPFGTAITSPLPASQSTISNTTTQNSSPISPSPLYPDHQPQPVVANQATALKYAPISPLTNNYPRSGSRPLMSMFSCFPRRLGAGGERKGVSSSSSSNTGKRRKFRVKILERHPYTTQTFCPLGLASEQEAQEEKNGSSRRETYFLVVVAPSLSEPATIPSSSSSSSRIQIQHPPDLSKLRAFVAHGGQAVTYGPGTWHAPMVVLGKRRVDFVVTQFVSGIPDEDCQEVLIGGGDEDDEDDEEAGGITVDLERGETTRSKL